MSNVLVEHQPDHSTFIPHADPSTILGRHFMRDEISNLSPTITSRIGRKLLNEPHHPLAQLWGRIQEYFRKAHAPEEQFEFRRLDDPIVSVEENFDQLLFPLDHPGRSPQDSYYINRQFMLRTHMTAHERGQMALGNRRFLLAGDVYRRDEIDSSHYPVFHQIEGVRIFSPSELFARKHLYEDTPLPPSIEQILSECSLPSSKGDLTHDPVLVRLAMADLHRTLSGLLKMLFGEETLLTWPKTTFPFTHPSVEVEAFYGGKPLEVLGSGLLKGPVIHPRILNETPDAIGWAFGLGLERIAMVLHQIPDIRLFWSSDPRFLSQFASSSPTQNTIFVPFSRQPPIARDISFYLSSTLPSFLQNDLFEIVRGIAGDLVESVSLVDKYYDANKNLHSHCYRIIYRSMERTLTDQEVNLIQDEIRLQVQNQLGVTLR